MNVFVLTVLIQLGFSPTWISFITVFPDMVTCTEYKTVTIDQHNAEDSEWMVVMASCEEMAAEDLPQTASPL
jgi:hypothetical protein